MDLNHIAIFVRVVEAESFTAAAKLLDLPKSSVSRSVSRLEEELGVRLLQRTTRKLSLTDAGRAYFDRARNAISGLDDATLAVKDMSKVARGTVRVTAPPDLGAILLADIVARFVRKHPQIHIELALTSRNVDLVEEGFDIALRAGRLEASSLIARKLAVSSMGLFATTGYLRRRGRPREVADLATHDCVLFRARDAKATWKLTGPAGEESVDVTGPVNVDEITFVHRSIVAGVGVGMLPLLLCPAQAEQSELVRVLPEHAIAGGALSIVSPPSRYEPARVTLFREFLIANLASVRWNG